MLREEFINSKYAYRVNCADMRSFLEECDDRGFHWLRGGRATDFDPFKFYEGEKIEYVKPLQKVDDPNYVFVRCFNGNLDFSFQHDWYMNPYYDYTPCSAESST